MKYKNNLLLVVVIFVSFFLFNESLFVDIMEARNLVTAREMVTEGHWLLPQMNGELRLAKPPLPTWITAAGMQVFGVNGIWALRAIAGLMGALMLFYAHRLIDLLFQNRKLADTGSMVAATSFYIVFMSRSATWDIYTHAFIMGMIYYTCKGLQLEKGYREYFLLAGIFGALSFLSKGPVGFYALYLPALIAFVCVRKWKVFKRKFHWLLISIVFAFLVGSWWFLYVDIFHSNLLADTLQVETNNWVTYNTRPWYHYWSFPLQAGIWGSVGFYVIINFFINKKDRQEKEYQFTFLWTIGAVILLSLIPEKKERYLMPVLLPMAYVIAFYFLQVQKRWEENRMILADQIFVKFHWVLGVFIALAIPSGYYFLSRGGEATLRLLLLTVVSVVFLLFLLMNYKRRSPGKIFNYYLTVFITVMLLLWPVAKDMIVRNKNYRSIAEIQEKENWKDVPIYYVGQGLRMESIWRLGRKVKIVQKEIIQEKLPLHFLLLGNKEQLFLELESLRNQSYQIKKVDSFDENHSFKHYRKGKVNDLYEITKSEKIISNK